MSKRKRKPSRCPLPAEAIGLRGQIASAHGFPRPRKVFEDRCPTCQNARTIVFAGSRRPCPRCRQ